MNIKKICSIAFSLILTLTAVIPAVNSKAAGFSVRGDLNGDYSLDIADMVTLQKYLLSADTPLPENWKAADLCSDGNIDVFDLTLMRKELISPVTSAKITSPACQAAAFACADTEELLYYDNINRQVAPASLTKLLTASVALHYMDPNTVITVGSELNLVQPGSSLCLIRPGHKLKLYDLLTGMLMASGNDAAYTVAAAVGRAICPYDYIMSDSQAVDYFVSEMNQYASQLGMKNSHFVSPEGWDYNDQYSTVSDLLILAQHAFSIPEIKTITGTYQKYVVFASGENITWTNTNALLNPNSPYYCPEAAGIKTGTTANAGNCLIAAFNRNGKTYISAVIGCASSNERYELTLKMLSKFTNNSQIYSAAPVTTLPSSSAAEITDSTPQTPDADEKNAIFSRIDSLDYLPITCDGLPDYKLTTDDGSVFWLNLDSKWIWKNGIDAEAILPDDIIEWLIINQDSINLQTTEYYENNHELE